MDFVADRLSNGRPFRMLTLVDNFSRVSPAIEVDFSLTGQRVVEVLERLSSSYINKPAGRLDTMLRVKRFVRRAGRRACPF